MGKVLSKQTKIDMFRDLEAEPKALREYRTLVAKIDRLCRRIRRKFGKHITCKKGCAGNCCQRHISVFPIEAISFAQGLQNLPSEMVRHIRHKARSANSFGPCPLLEEGACLMYDSRAIICRTHGFPILAEYRGHRSIGFCQHNFKNLQAIPENAVIELEPLNSSLAAVNHQFICEFAPSFFADNRLSIGEALLLDVGSPVNRLEGRFTTFS
jgi:Fe-S-cluster containining protein